MGTGKEWVAMGTKYFIATKFQRFALQIDQDSSVYTLDVKLGWVYDIISHLICILIYTFFKLKYLQN